MIKMRSSSCSFLMSMRHAITLISLALRSKSCISNCGRFFRGPISRGPFSEHAPLSRCHRIYGWHGLGEAPTAPVVLPPKWPTEWYQCQRSEGSWLFALQFVVHFEVYWVVLAENHDLAGHRSDGVGAKQDVCSGRQKPWLRHCRQVTAKPAGYIHTFHI